MGDDSAAAVAGAAALKRCAGGNSNPKPGDASGTQWRRARRERRAFGFVVGQARPQRLNRSGCRCVRARGSDRDRQAWRMAYGGQTRQGQRQGGGIAKTPHPSLRESQGAGPCTGLAVEVHFSHRKVRQRGQTTNTAKLQTDPALANQLIAKLPPKGATRAGNQSKQVKHIQGSAPNPAQPPPPHPLLAQVSSDSTASRQQAESSTVFIDRLAQKKRPAGNKNPAGRCSGDFLHSHILSMHYYRGGDI